MNAATVSYKIKKLTVTAFLFTVTAFLFSGCVSLEKYQSLENQYTAARKELDQTREKVDRLEKEKNDLERIKNRIISDLEDELFENTARIQMLEERLKVTVVEKLFFDSGSAIVKHGGRDIISKIADTLKQAQGMEIRVTGHADSLPPGNEVSQKYPSNWELSTARAASIIQILQWGYQINPKRMVAEGVAHYRPSVMETDQNRAMNRFVEITLKAIPQDPETD